MPARLLLLLLLLLLFLLPPLASSPAPESPALLESLSVVGPPLLVFPFLCSCPLAPPVWKAFLSVCAALAGSSASASVTAGWPLPLPVVPFVVSPVKIHQLALDAPTTAMTVRYQCTWDMGRRLRLRADLEQLADELVQIRAVDRRRQGAARAARGARRARLLPPARDHQRRLNAEIAALRERQRRGALAERRVARDEEGAVDVVVVVELDALDVGQVLLLELADGEVFDLWEGPAVREVQDGFPVLGVCLIQ